MLDRFDERLKEKLNPGLPAKEMVEMIVRSALEAEFGPTFAHSKGFDKMVGAIADTIVANPDLRRESLSIASSYIEKKIKVTKAPQPPVKKEFMRGFIYDQKDRKDLGNTDRPNR